MCVWYSWSLDTLIFQASRGRRGRWSVSAARRAANHIREAALLCRRTLEQFGPLVAGHHCQELSWSARLYLIFFLLSAFNIKIMQWHSCDGTLWWMMVAATPAENLLQAEGLRLPLRRVKHQLSAVQNHSGYAHFEKWRQQIKNIFLSAMRGARPGSADDHLFVRYGWMIINAVSAQLLPVAYVQTQGNIVQMMEGVYKCSSLTNRVMASRPRIFRVCKCYIHKFQRHLKTIIFSEFYEKLCFHVSSERLKPISRYALVGFRSSHWNVSLHLSLLLLHQWQTSIDNNNSISS